MIKPRVPQALAVAWRVATGGFLAGGLACAQAYLDNNSLYSNQDPNTETRRSDHFRMNFGHYNRDTGTPMTEQLAQGNLQEYEQMWHRWVVEMGLHDLNESATAPDGNKYRANFNFLMTWNDGGGGGAFTSMDSGGFFYSMANTSSCRYDPPSGTTPHEFGHVWEGTCAGFNGSNSSGAWWECTANWMLLQFLNSYPQAGGYISNGMYYPAHGRDYYDSWVIWEAAKDDPRYGPAWVNSMWCNATADQQVNEFILDRMIRLDSSGSADKAGAMNDLWGDMARKMVTWDFARQRWLAQANSADDGSDWNFYQRCRTPLVKLPGASGWYRPSRDHIPMEFGFNFIPLAATPGSVVSCNFQPQCDPVRQSDWRACLVAVDNAGAASYSGLWNSGTNSISLSADQAKLYLVVIATPKPMKIADPAWQAYLTDAGLQFPYAVAFGNAAPRNVVYPVQGHSGMLQHANGGGWKASSATVDATAYLGPNAQVLGAAQVRGSARVDDYAVVKDSAQVRDNAVVSGHAMVEANAQVYGNAKVRDWGHVFGFAEIYESARVIEHGNCGDGNATTHTKVYGNAVIKGTTYVYDTSTFNGGLIMEGDSANGNGTTPSSSGVHFGWGWGEDTARFASLPDNGYQYSGLTFERDNAVFACDEFGINHGFLMNGCRTAVDGGAALRGGRVLPLDGISQYVELHNSVNDFRDSTFAVWCKSSGGAADQRLWSLGDGAGKAMYLTPNAAATGKPRFVITDGTTTQTLDSGAAMPANTWNHLAVVFSGATCSLYLNGAAVATNAAMSLWPDSLNAPLMENANYLGRGNAGNYFQGSLDDFRCFMRAFSAADVLALFNAAAPAPITLAADNTPPTPDAATWLVPPMANGDSSATMSATPGSDASGWVEYDFACVSGGGHDSGWVSFNKYTDVGLTPGSAPAYTVRMRDRAGNTTGASAAATANLATSGAGTASFSFGPIGIADGQITMSATQGSSPSGKLEYKFDRTLPTTASSGWQASATWTQSGLTTGTTYTYTVTVRDGRGNVSAPSAPASAIARDDAGPALPTLSYAHWQMLPYATIDNKVSMTAMNASDPSGVQYDFHCVSGGGPDSGWQTSATYVTPALADGTYVYQYKVRDLSARNNESGYSTTYAATITPTTGYHSASFAQTASLPDDSLVTFNGVVMQAYADHYVVKDVASNATITVTTDQYAQATDPAKVLKLCQINGHLWTYGGTRLVTYAAISPIMDPPAFAVSGQISDASSGVGIAGATVYFSTLAGAAANASLTATTDANGLYSEPLPNGQWYVAAAAPEHFPASDLTLTVNGMPLANVNLSLNPAFTITASVGAGGSASPSGVVLLTNGANQTFTIAPNGGESISSVLIDGVEQGSVASYAFNNVTANHTIAVTFAANATHIPQTASLLDSALAASFPAGGLTGNWTSYLPAGKTYTAMGTPTVNTLNNAKWDLNLRSDGDGFDCGDHGATAIPCSGATIVAVVKPVRNTTGDSWNSIVDVFYDRLVLGIHNNSGQLVVRRNGGLDSSSSALADGQTTVLTLIVQPDGSYKLYANGTQVPMSGGAAIAGGFTSLVPGVAGAFATHINIGRNNPDGWTVFNGNIGDFFIYNLALGDADRQALEGDMSSKFGIATPHTITASAGSGGTLSPAGTLSVTNGGSATFVARPSIGYAISQLVVDGVSQGALTSYTFSDVAANHTITASFTSVPTYTITASAGANGSLSPSGALVVNAGSNQTFSVTPNTGYQVADVLVDGVSQGALASCTFNNVQAAHTVSATFSLRVCAITASAATGGSITPSGTTNVSFGANQTCAITPNANYAISSVIVDGVDIGAPASYTFTSVIANHTIAAVFIAGARQIPAADQLFVALDTKDIVGSSSITSWPWLWPTGKFLTNIASPTVQTISSVKWEWNMRTDSDGFRVGQYSTSIPVNGGTIVCAIKPTRNTTADGWNSVVDVMYGEMVLGVSNSTGLPQLRLKKAMVTGATAIPDGQKTVLTLVVQPGGAYTVYANGVSIMSGSGAAMTEWLPGNTTGNPTAYDSYIDIGRSDPDGWSAFNGNIGDVFLYKTALTDAQRQRLEADMMSKFGISGGSGGTYTITASAATGGSISPAGATLVNSAASQAYTITANGGYAIADVQIDGISVGVAGSYMFTNVLANHTISATFAVATSFTVSASAGAGGTISPSGSLIVNSGASQSFTIAPSPGFAISQVTADTVPLGALGSYTFNNVVADHAISATFSPLPTPGTTLARHSGTGSSSTYGDALSFDVSVTGTPTPTGSVALKDGGASGTSIGGGTLSNGACTIATSVLTVGSHTNIVAVYSGDSHFLTATSSALDTQTVNKATPTVTVTGPTSFTYNGSPQGPNSVTTGGSTGVVTYSYVGVSGTPYGPSSTAPAGVGSYTLTATVAADANYNSATSSATAFTISKATPTVTVTVGSYIYNGSPQGPGTATTGGSTGALTFSYAGGNGTTYGPSSTKPTGAGSYSVTATVAPDSNYNSASSGATSFTLAKATPSLSVTNSPVAYTGAAQAAMVTGSVAGIASGVKYNGSATVPTVVATYAITADFVPADGGNFNNLAAAPAGNFVITPPLITTAGTATATASQAAITVTMPYADDGNASNTYTLEYKMSSGGAWTTWAANAAHTASPYTATITGLTPGTSYDIRATYNDADGVTGPNPQGLTVLTGNAGIAELSGWTNLYHGTVTQAQNFSYIIPSGSRANRVLVIAIAAPRTSTGTRSVTLAYGGQALTRANGDMATSTVRQHTALYYLNEAGLDAATSTTLAATVSGGSSRVTDIFAAVYDGVDQANPIADSKQYNGGTTAVSTFAFGTGLTVNAGNQAVEIICADLLGSTTPRTVSSYAPNWSLATQQTYATTDAVRNLVTKRAVPAVDASADPTPTTMSGTALVSMTALSLTNAKVTPALVVANSTLTYNGSAQAATVNGSVAGTVGNVKYNGSATVPTAAGSYAVSADFTPADTVNFSSLTAASAGNLVIQKAAASVTLGDLTQTYDGAPKTVSATTVPPQLAVGLTYDGFPTPPTYPGTYAVVATVNEVNYAGTASGSLVIVAEGIAAWRFEHFTPAEIANGLAVDSADADGDGLANLTEYILGTDPRAFNPQPLALTPAAGNTVNLTFLARSATGAGYAGLTRKYSVECTADLADPASWQALPGYSDIVGGDQSVIVTLPVAASKQFYRLNVRLE